MNIFFGKISQKFDTVQLEEGYYSAPEESSWFGELQPQDYVFMIGGDKVQFWKAREWGEKNGNHCMHFDIINADLGINVSEFITLKFFQITKALAVLTSRSTRNKAFFKLEMLKDIPVADLSSSQFYKNVELFRTIKIIKREDVNDDSEDIQLIYENNKLELVDNNFIDDSIKKEFVDNLDKKGKGARMKDNVLEFFSNAVTDLPTTITHRQIGFRSFYDTFFCEYKENTKYYLVGAFWDDSTPQDQTERFVKESNWLNGYTDKFNNIVNAVPIGSHIAIKAAFVRAKTNSVMTIKAKGIVTNNLNDGQTLEVEWEEDFEPFEVNFGGYMKTIKEVTKKNHIEAIWFEHEQKQEICTTNKETDMQNLPLNQILYGPPGTGKTYNTINKALDILGEDVTGKPREDIKKFYDAKVKEGQIIFTTFHQSMSYEDFIEGIKPEIDENEDGSKQVIYEIKDGIFKQLVKKARKIITKAEPTNTEYTFDDSWNDLIDEANKNLGENTPLALSIQTPNLGLKIVDVSSKGNLKLKPIYSEDAKEYIVSYNRAKKLQEVFPDLSIIKNIDKEFRAVIGGSNSTAYWAVLNYLNKKINANSKISSNEIVLPALPHVLIIDEINRGNVSQIFGELITLIEEDKRLGKDEALEVTLPYSKEKFGVPPNLYIIGTMNTADRSVEALDTALRRRFSFEEMMPKAALLSPSAMYCNLLWKHKDIEWDDEPFTSEEKDLFELLGAPQSLINERKLFWEVMKKENTPEKLNYFDSYNDELTGINLKTILETINQRIEILLDRDHTIGHSYFMKVNNVNDLKHTFKNNIIPLLQEYFYNDYGKIGLVLGKGFVREKTITAKNDTSIFADFYTKNEIDIIKSYELIPFEEITDIKNACLLLLGKPTNTINELTNLETSVN